MSLNPAIPLTNSDPTRRGSEWISDFVARLQQDLPNVSPITLASVPSSASVWGDAELAQLSGAVAAERWLSRSNRVYSK